MLIILFLIVAFILCFFICAFAVGIVKAIDMTPDEWREFVEDRRMEKKQKKESKRLYRSIESRAYEKYPGLFGFNYDKRKKYIDKHL
nr:MAG TPA: HemY protein N-terminus [Caudoviricetes sp.]